MVTIERGGLWSAIDLTKKEIVNRNKGHQFRKMNSMY
jgi:hypothetical protein